MKASEIRNMTPDEIEQKLLSLKEELFSLRKEISTGRVERPTRFKQSRRDIARCNTILKEKISEEKKS